MIADPLNDGLGEIQAKLDAANAAFPGFVVLTKPLLTDEVDGFPLKCGSLAGLSAAHAPKLALDAAGLACMEQTAQNIEHAWQNEVEDWWKNAISAKQLGWVARFSRSERRPIFMLEALELLSSG